MASSNYSAWSVIAGEQPTTAKWNILGTNDASFNSGVGMEDQTITNRHIALNAVFKGLKTTAAETTFTNGSYVDVGGMVITFTTTKANQVVCLISSFQTYQGGYSLFRYVLDGTATGDPVKYQTGINSTTTGVLTFVDYFTVVGAGSHSVQLQANGGSASLLRIIHSEGTGRMVALLG